MANNATKEEEGHGPLVRMANNATKEEEGQCPLVRMANNATKEEEGHGPLHVHTVVTLTTFGLAILYMN